VEHEHEILKVSATTVPNKLAGAIVKSLNAGKRVKVTAIGDRPINQACKGMAISNQFLAPAGKRLDIVPAFGMLENSVEEVTTFNFYLKLKDL
jgi:stage V sporulation protein S